MIRVHIEAIRKVRQFEEKYMLSHFQGQNK